MPIQWAIAGKYLGYFIGPCKGEQLWAKKMAKFVRRLSEWKWSALGLNMATPLHNIHVDGGIRERVCSGAQTILRFQLRIQSIAIKLIYCFFTLLP